MMIQQNSYSAIISKQMIRYGVIGVVNTSITLSCIFILTGLTVPLYLANIIGYLFGILISYLLNSKYTFCQQLSYLRMFNFFIVVALSYLFNLVTIHMVLSISTGAVYLSQFLGMLVYTLMSFFLNKYWVLK